MQYWSTETNLILYCGSIFVGHCTSRDLLQNFNEIGDEMKWKADLLLRVGMDGPNVNIKFNTDK